MRSGMGRPRNVALEGFQLDRKSPGPSRVSDRLSRTAGASADRDTQCLMLRSVRQGLRLRPLEMEFMVNGNQPETRRRFV